MTYSANAAKAGRRPIHIVTIEFDGGDQVYTTVDTMLPVGFVGFPTLDKITITPSELKPLDGLATRGRVSLTLLDFPTGAAGTHWGKLLASETYYNDRRIKVGSGFLETDGSINTSNFEYRYYYITKIDGPDARGRVRVDGKDILHRLDGERSLVPKKTSSTLTAAVDAVELGSQDIGNIADWPTSGYCICEDEIIEYNSASGTSISFAGRGRLGTTAAAHDAGKPIRAIYTDLNTNVADTIVELLEDFASIATAQIDTSGIATEKNNYLQSEIFDTIVIEPTPVKDVIADLAKQSFCSVWVDEINQQIKLKVLRAEEASALSTDYTDTDHIIEDGIDIKRDFSNQATQVWVYHGKVSPLKDDKPEHYEKLRIVANLTIEGASYYNYSRVIKIFAKHIPEDNDSTAQKIAKRYLTQYSHGSRYITMRLDAKDRAFWVGDVIDIQTDLIQDANGAAVLKTADVIAAREIENGAFEYTCLVKPDIDDTDNAQRLAEIAPNSATATHTAASSAERYTYFYIAQNDELMPNGDPGYEIQ